MVTKTYMKRNDPRGLSQKSIKASKPRPKVNALKPSMREKKRYIAFEIVSEKPLGKDADRQLIIRINELLGVFHSSKAGILRVKYNPGLQRGLLRVDRAFVDFIRTCFVMLKQLEGIRVMIRTLAVSGMVHRAAAMVGE
ncbi:ribonuclease P protein component 2 [Candidatus Woesearchaeota archaeon]|nr:ribonuclease P protein component 2 [Candidatus Woesearchaeota archaeon]